LAVNVNKFLPAALDWYLGRTGYDSQQHDGSLGADRPDNLYQPVSGDWGAHGEFDNKAKDRSIQLDLALLIPHLFG